MKTQIFSIILSITLLVSSAVAEDKKTEKDPNAYEKGSVAASLRQSLEAAGVSKGTAAKTESQPAAVATAQTVVQQQPAVVYQQAPAPQQVVVVREVAAPVERNFTVVAGGSSHGSSRRSSGLNLGGLIRIGSEACGYPVGSLGSWGMNPGEQAAYERGLIKEQDRLQRDRERDAYNAGRTAARRGW